MKRNIQIIARVDENEYFQLKRTARHAGFSVAGFIRRCCLGKEKVVIIDGDVVGDIYTEVNRIGNNINQIARIANTDKSISQESIDRVEAWLYQVKRIVDEKFGGVKY
ncbi:MAG: plasmid mobilization relaxosome protein MobC [Christensenellaceae bacterium]